jgi:hypothetical protein
MSFEGQLSEELIAMAKNPNYPIYSEVLNFHCKRFTGHPTLDGSKLVRTKLELKNAKDKYYQWLSEGLGITFESLTETHLTGISRPLRSLGSPFLAGLMGFNIKNPCTPEEKQAIWEFQIAFEESPTTEYYNEALDRIRIQLKKKYLDIYSGTFNPDTSNNVNLVKETDGESRDKDSLQLPLIDFRQRILDRSVGLNGAFGKSLYANLRRTFPNQTRGKADLPELVADCFVDAEKNSLLNLFSVLKHARPAVKDLAASEADLLAELTVQVTLRSIDWDLSGLRGEKPVGDVNNQNARFSSLQMRSSLVASLGFAGLYGLTIQIGAGSPPVGVYDLSDALLHFDVSASVLRVLYDEVRKRDLALPPRLNPDELTGSEEGRLRDHFDDLQYLQNVAVVYIRTTVLDAVQAETILSQVAQAINSRVVLGSNRNPVGLVHPGTQLTFESLEIKVQELFGIVNRPSSSGSNPA